MTRKPKPLPNRQLFSLVAEAFEIAARALPEKAPWSARHAITFGSYRVSCVATAPAARAVAARYRKAAAALPGFLTTPPKPTHPSRMLGRPHDADERLVKLLEECGDRDENGILRTGAMP